VLSTDYEQLGDTCRTDSTRSVGPLLPWPAPAVRELPAPPAAADDPVDVPLAALPDPVDVAEPDDAVPSLLPPSRSSVPRISTWLFTYFCSSESLPPSSLTRLILPAIPAAEVPLVAPAADPEPAPLALELEPLVPDADILASASMNFPPPARAPDVPLVPELAAPEVDPAVPEPLALEPESACRQPVIVTCCFWPALFCPVDCAPVEPDWALTPTARVPATMVANAIVRFMTVPPMVRLTASCKCNGAANHGKLAGR
jgi:hypothetical protein